MRTASELDALALSASTVGAGELAPDVDEYQLQCHYCRCDHQHPCLLDENGVPDTRGRPFPDGEPCFWHRIVEFAGQGYFAVCSNSNCVRAYLGDPRAP